MRISLPYAFTVDYMKVGKASPSSKTLVGWVNAEVPEPYLTEVEVVAEWYVNSIGNRPRYLATCISYRGDFYVEVMDEDAGNIFSLPRYPGDPAGSPSAIYDIVGKASLNEREVAMLHSAMEGNVTGTRSVYSVVNGNRANHEVVVKRCAESLIHCHDRFWRKVPWIGLELSSFLDGYKIDVATGPIGFDAKDPDLDADMFRGPGYMRRFGLDELERAKAHAEEHSFGFGFVNLTIAAELPEFDAERDYILRCINFALVKTNAHVGDMPPEFVSDWLILRDTYAACSSGSGEFPDDIRDVLRHFTQAIQDERAKGLMEDALNVLEDFTAERGPKVNRTSAPASYL